MPVRRRQQQQTHASWRSLAVTALILLPTSAAFSLSTRPSQSNKIASSLHVSSLSSSYDSSENNNENNSRLQGFLDDMQKAELEDENIENMISQRQALMKERFQTVAATNSGFRVQLPMGEPSGLSIGSGNAVLNLDTLRITESPSPKLTSEDALYVTAVAKGSIAERSGVQVGDAIKMASATLGGKLWPVSTLSGLASAVRARRLTNSAATLELERLTATSAAALETEDAVVVDGPYELKLKRPLGFEIGEDENGYVVVTKIHTDAPKLVHYAIAVGDRITAVDSSLGDKLWNVSTVEGVISAVTTRLPGQSVNMRFLRPHSVGVFCAQNPMQTLPNAPADVAVVPATEAQEQMLPPVASQKELIQRCRDALRRYTTNADSEKEDQTAASYKMSAMVTDKVVDALASASSSIDCVTLHMIMQSYLRCGQAASAIRVFEAATGFSGDGSSNPAKTVIASTKEGNSGQIVPNDDALNLFTGTALMQAHTNSLDSVLRILAALEGQSGKMFGQLDSAPWPWTGQFGSIRPDVTLYNIVLQAAAEHGNIRVATSIFDRISEKTVVTYNTMIAAFSNVGDAQSAFALMEEMKKQNLKPDKYTYTSLIKVCDSEDVDELLYNMRELGIQPDVLTYNTVIKKLCRERYLPQALRMVPIMENAGVAPDAHTYNSLMTGLLKAGKATACLNLFEAAVSLRLANVHTYTTAITAATVMRDHEHALKLVQRMTGNGIQPSLQSLTAVVSACLSSNQGELAVQLYETIQDPDGYAMRQGIRAYCMVGNAIASAAILKTQVRGKRRMNGKEMMLSYKSVLATAMRQADFVTARSAVTDLLAKGYIPNKATLIAIVESLQIKRYADATVGGGQEHHADRFSFLLFMLDSLQKRNLPVEGLLYMATLTVGAQLGGDYRLVAKRLTQAKQKARTQSKTLFGKDDDGEDYVKPIAESWEELLTKTMNGGMESMLEQRQLPRLQVRSTPADARRILRAEQMVQTKSNAKQQLQRTTSR